MANKIVQLTDADNNNIYPIGYAQGGVKMDLLWQAEAINTPMNSVTTLNINFEPYDIIVIGTNVQVSNANNLFCYNLFVIKDLVQKNLKGDMTSEHDGVRLFTMTNSSITFQGPNASGRCTPINIYGIKTSYIVPTTVNGLQYVEVE